MSFYLKDLLPGRSLSWLSAPVPDGSYFLGCLLGRKPQCGRAFTALRQPQGDSSFGFWLTPPPPPPANMARDAASSDSSFRSLYEIEPEAEGQGQHVQGRPCHVSSHASSDRLSSVQ